MTASVDSPLAGAIPAPPKAPQYDLFSRETALDPYPVLHRLREEDPVHYSPGLHGWLVTRYDDIAKAIKDPALTTASMVSQIDRLPEEQRRELAPLRTSIAMWMGHTDPDDHARMQRVLKKYFTPGMVEALRPRAQAITDELVSAFERRGHAEVVADLAYPLPARVIAEMLGVPAEDRDLLPRWSRDITAVFQPLNVARLLQSQKSVVEMSEYMRGLVADRRRSPRDDLISALVQAEAEGGIRDEEEILANCVLLLFAGHETTAALLGKGLLLLLQHPGELALLRQRPDLLPNAVEEMLRVDGPASIVPRFAVAALELGGKAIEPGHLVYPALGAGNRDPAYYPDPDRFDITRSTARHLAFGQGLTYCLGAALARMEAQVGFSTLLRRVPDLRLGPEGPSWEVRPPFARHLESLPIVFSPPQ
jgi:cytochrome P450